MRLLDTLIKKRDFHLAQAGKFADLIAVLESDDDIGDMVQRGKLRVANGAKAHFDATQMPVTKRGRRSVSAKERKIQGLRMKKLWKTRRAFMIKAMAKRRKNAHAARRAKKAATETATT